MTKQAAERPDHEIAREELSALMAREGLTITSIFVPFSQSRNAVARNGSDKPWGSLNWKVRLRYDRHRPNVSTVAYTILETDYSAGEAHCPSYKQNARRTVVYDDRLVDEIETGRGPNGKAIKPDAVDVFSSLCTDSDVLNAGGFENWASEYGYDTDSRAAEATYRACLEIALKFRAELGDAVLTEARELSQRL